jgi:uridine phosphorylase
VVVLNIDDRALFCPVGPLVWLAARMFKAKKNPKPLGLAAAYTIKYQGAKASLVGPGMGAPAAVFALERMIANGARHVIMVGLAGSLSPRVHIGDLLAVESAWVEEGVSAHYFAGVKKAVSGVRALEAIRESVAAYGRSCHVGPVWTTDALFRETKKKVHDYGQRGLLGVEMEVSALFNVARYRGIEMGALLVISDELFDLRWRAGFTRPRFLNSLRHAAHIGLAAAFRLAGKDIMVPAPLPADEIAEGDDEREAREEGSETKVKAPREVGDDERGP